MRYLHFEYSEDEQENGTFDAIANVAAHQWTDLSDEVQQVLVWAHAQAQPQALQDGGVWDYALDVTEEWTHPRHVAFEVEAGRLSLDESSQTSVPARLRYALSFVVTAVPSFSAAFHAKFVRF